MRCEKLIPLGEGHSKSIFHNSIHFTYPYFSCQSEYTFYFSKRSFQNNNEEMDLFYRLFTTANVHWVRSLVPLPFNWCNSVRVVGFIAGTHFFSSVCKFFMGFRPGLRNGHSDTYTSLSLSQNLQTSARKSVATGSSSRIMIVSIESIGVAITSFCWKYAEDHYPAGRPSVDRLMP